MQIALCAHRVRQSAHQYAVTLRADRALVLQCLQRPRDHFARAADREGQLLPVDPDPRSVGGRVGAGMLTLFPERPVQALGHVKEEVIGDLSLCALEPRDSGILLTTLRSYDEIRDAGAILDRSLPKPDRQMLESTSAMSGC